MAVQFIHGHLSRTPAVDKVTWASRASTVGACVVGTDSRSVLRAPVTGQIRSGDANRRAWRPWLSRDVIAGVMLVSLTIPEVMGYSKIAGTPE